MKLASQKQQPKVSRRYVSFTYLRSHLIKEGYQNKNFYISTPWDIQSFFIKKARSIIKIFTGHPKHLIQTPIHWGCYHLSYFKYCVVIQG